MSDDAVAILAAAIVTVRGASTIPAIRKALEDAEWILYPKPGDARYKLWEESNGETPTIGEGDATVDKQREETQRSALRNFRQKM